MNLEFLKNLLPGRKHKPKFRPEDLEDLVEEHPEKWEKRYNIQGGEIPMPVSRRREPPEPDGPDIVFDSPEDQTPPKPLRPPFDPTRRINPDNKFRVAVVDTSDAAEHQARDRADASMSENKEDLKGLKGYCKKIWKHNLFQGYYRQKELIKVREEIRKSGNIYEGSTGIDEQGNEYAYDLSHSQAAMRAVVERFQKEGEEYIHKDAGESLDDSEQAQKAKEVIRNLILDYAEDKDMTPEDFQKKKVDILQEYSGQNPDFIDKGLIYSDAMFEIALQVRQKMDSDSSLNALDFDLDIVLGQAKTGVRTGSNYHKIEKHSDKILKSKTLELLRKATGCALVNETTLSLAVAAAHSLGAATVKRVAGGFAKFVPIVGTALVGGAAAAARENRRLKDERRQHGREMAQGYGFKKEAKRREEIEKYRYESKNVMALIENMKNAVYDKDGQIKDLSQEEIDAASKLCSEIRARVYTSDSEQKDLLEYSSIDKVEEERLRLDEMMDKVSKDLKEIAQLKDLKIPNLDKLHDDAKKELKEGESGMEKKDKLFKAMKRRKTAAAMFKGMVIGGVIGMGFQELSAAWRSDIAGVLTSKKPGATSVTALQSLLHYMGFSKAPDVSMPGAGSAAAANVLTPAGKPAEVITSSGKPPMVAATGESLYNVKRLDNIKIVNTERGPLVMKGNDVLFEGKLTDANGQITPEAKAALGKHNIVYEAAKISASGPVSDKQFIENHKGDFIKRSIDKWMDNDSKAPDKNEVKFNWGGVKGSGIDKNGSIAFSIKNMTPDGSKHGAISVDALKECRNGNMFVLFSLSKATQGEVIAVPIGANGEVKLDPNNPLYKVLFEKDAKGKAVFKGYNAEVAKKLNGNNYHILATHRGSASANFTGQAPASSQGAPEFYERTPVQQPGQAPANLPVAPIPSGSQADLPIDPASGLETELPYISRLAGRRPLEKAVNPGSIKKAAATAEEGAQGDGSTEAAKAGAGAGGESAETGDTAKNKPERKKKPKGKGKEGAKKPVRPAGEPESAPEPESPSPAEEIEFDRQAAEKHIRNEMWREIDKIMQSYTVNGKLAQEDLKGFCALEESKIRDVEDDALNFHRPIIAKLNELLSPPNFPLTYRNNKGQAPGRLGFEEAKDMVNSIARDMGIKNVSVGEKKPEGNEKNCRVIFVKKLGTTHKLRQKYKERCDL